MSFDKLVLWRAKNKNTNTNNKKNKNNNRNKNSSRNNKRNKNNNRNNNIKRTMTSGPTVVGKYDTPIDMDGPIRYSTLTLQGDENQREHRKPIRQ
jgi:hypothetical protein